MGLFSFKKGSGPARVWLHGLLGNCLNLYNVAVKLPGTHYFVDARNHGKSPKSLVFTYESMAEDLMSFLDSINENNATVIGHSLGGKTVMTAASLYPDHFKRIAVLDVAPIDHYLYHIDYSQRILSYITLINNTSLTGKTRETVVRELNGQIADSKVVDWLCMNLVMEPSGLVWKAEIGCILANYRNIADFPKLTRKFLGSTLAVVGELSEHTSKSKALGVIGHTVADLYRPLFPNIKVKQVEGAGHWLHFEKPAEVTEALREFLNEDA